MYVPHFEEFALPLLVDLVDGNRVKMLLCPIRAVRRYLSRIEDFSSECSNLFVLMTNRKN